MNASASTNRLQEEQEFDTYAGDPEPSNTTFPKNSYLAPSIFAPVIHLFLRFFKEADKPNLVPNDLAETLEILIQRMMSKDMRMVPSFELGDNISRNPVTASPACNEIVGNHRQLLTHPARNT